ncbi:MAG TPA: hypothetical protein VK822_15925 [Acetobacteraceae bacterium]|jgi:hypothetical protein|nr:hypothetical protein [Acetobacteraceae bacterium]
MSGYTRGRPPQFSNIVLGVLRLARGRADGIRQFGATREAFLASLAPLIAFPLVGGVLMLLGGGGLTALGDLLATLCALVAPPVLSFEVARLWGRQNAWLRFATAFNWCQWVIPVIGTLLLVVLGTLAALGLPRTVASASVVLGLVSYGLWLHWFLARHGLGLSRVRAALLVFGVNFGTVLLVLGPRMLALIGDGGLGEK